MADNIQKEGMLKVGTHLANGKYRIDQYLASGGFGNTYVATDLTFNEKVAIKELFIKGVCGRKPDSTGISVSLSENQRAFSAQREKFRKEAKRIRKLNNPHIIHVHDLFDENGTSYYVMDFVEGESLSARLKRTKKPMTEPELMLLIPQVLDALECVHSEGIWHLDLKPANVMVDAKGNVQLIDFGASKQLKNANGDSLSTSSAMTYTAGYASSEQMEQNFEKFGPWTDLYSLGATMYNLLTMQQPPSPSDIDEDSQTALKLPKNISKKTERLICWLMKPNRKMRPQSVTDVKQFLVEEMDHPVIPDPEDDEEDDNTIVKHGGHRTSEPQQDTVPTYQVMLRKWLLPAVAVVCIAGGVLLMKDCVGGKPVVPVAPDDSTAVTDKAQAPAMKHVEGLAITVTSGPSNMRQYAFTGDLADTLGALPNGEGVAKFAKYGDIPASTYKGRFVNGICEDHTGQATMTFVSGDKYVGTFKNGYYDRGKYLLSDGSYFEGSFKDGAPYNGTWYNAQGKPDGKVVNGADQ